MRRSERVFVVRTKSFRRSHEHIVALSRSLDSLVLLNPDSK